MLIFNYCLSPMKTKKEYSILPKARPFRSRDSMLFPISWMYSFSKVRNSNYGFLFFFRLRRGR